MKKRIIKIALALLVGSFMLTGCADETTPNETKKQDTEVIRTEYYCPMKCEGEKIYSEKGSCPKCGMDLVVKE